MSFHTQFDVVCRVVRPKKHLGQHFLKDQRIALRIVESLPPPAGAVLEIGPGTGVLTQYLVDRADVQLKVIEIDRESVAYLHEHYPSLSVVEGDFLTIPLPELFDTQFRIIGNFPYNISSQIFFRVLEHRQQVLQVVCMLQKEVAERICAPPGSRTYGILSVLLGAFYSMEYLFKVPPGVFQPPPKVMSAVIRLTRNDRQSLPCDEHLFFRIVKESFQKRRKTLRNGLKHLNLTASVESLPIMDKRPEQLTVDEFISLARLIGEREGDR